MPSYLGRIIKIAYGEQVIFQLVISSDIINTYLPYVLHAFPTPITITDRIKRDFIYSKPMIFTSRSQLSGEMQNLSSFVSEADFFEQLLPKQMSMVRCNMVILGDRIILARIPQTYKLPYYLLCKHITLTDHSVDIRFAGEFWRDDDEGFRLNNNSGTYRPSKTLVESTVALFNHLFPFLEVQGLS
ncbi:unnamed protein product [Rotaria sp. Silwood1]|nr:unnamed protein product [Rotaria sp. Silwood1]